MPVLTIKLEGDGAWPELEDGRKVHHVTTPFEVCCLEGGMRSGKPSVAFKIDLEDGSTVLVETSLALFLAAGRAFLAKYGDPTG